MPPMLGPAWPAPALALDIQPVVARSSPRCFRSHHRPSPRSGFLAATEHGLPISRSRGRTSFQFSRFRFSRSPDESVLPYSARTFDLISAGTPWSRCGEISRSSTGGIYLSPQVASAQIRSHEFYGRSGPLTNRAEPRTAASQARRRTVLVRSVAKGIAPVFQRHRRRGRLFFSGKSVGPCSLDQRGSSIVATCVRLHD